MTPAREGRRSSGWTALWRLAAAQRGRITLLALASFAAAMVEAAFLVLVTGLLLAISSGRDGKPSVCHGETGDCGVAYRSWRNHADGAAVALVDTHKLSRSERHDEPIGWRAHDCIHPGHGTGYRIGCECGTCCGGPFPWPL